MQRTHAVFIGLGSNLGEPLFNCLEAIEKIDLMEGTRVLKRSPFYRTEPVGMMEQDWFINCIVKVLTRLQPKALLTALREIENTLGRRRTQKWGPRVIDLDILFYDDLVMRTSELTIPHPRLHERRFVLVPLCDIDPHFQHPVFDISVEGLLRDLRDSKGVEPMEVSREVALR